MLLQHIIRSDSASSTRVANIMIASLLQRSKSCIPNDFISVAVFFNTRCWSWSLLAQYDASAGAGYIKHPNHQVGGEIILDSSASYITDYAQLLDMSSNSTASLDSFAQEVIVQLPVAYAFRLSYRTNADFTPALLAGILHFLLQVISILFIGVRFIKY